MGPEIIERPRILLAGIIGSGKDVTTIDIRGMWNAYSLSESKIENRIDGAWYELHVGEKLGNGIYSVLAGAQIERIDNIPPEVSLRVVPAGKYAHFSHQIKDGGFKGAFAKVEAWIKESQANVKDFGLQHYDRDFDPGNDDSILNIYIPLDE